MSRRSLTALITCLAVAACPAGAAAQGTTAPPGLSGADQYLETVPGSGGNSAVGNGQRPSLDDPAVKSAASTALPAGTVKALTKRGPAGKDAAALAARTAPATDRSAVPALAPKADGGSPLAALGRVATGGAGGDGMGVLFPLLIIGGTLFVAGSALWRRRGDGGTPA